MLGKKDKPSEKQKAEKPKAEKPKATKSGHKIIASGNGWTMHEN